MDRVESLPGLPDRNEDGKRCTDRYRTGHAENAAWLYYGGRYFPRRQALSALHAKHYLKDFPNKEKRSGDIGTDAGIQLTEKKTNGTAFHAQFSFKAEIPVLPVRCIDWK